MSNDNIATSGEADEIQEYELPYNYILKKPIQLSENNTVTEINFKNAVNGGMIEHLPAGGSQFMKMGHFYPIISKMTGETLITIKKMEFDDLQKCIEVVGSFLGDSPETTENTI